MSAIKQATLALALLAGTTLGAQAQMSGGNSGGTGTAAGNRPVAPTTPPARAGHSEGTLGTSGLTGRGNAMPNNSDIGTGPAGPSVAGRPTSPGNSAPQTR